MGLAVPAALTVAIGRGAQFGVLIKGGEALERVAGLQAVVMDKTGTLTLGKPSLVGIATLGNFVDADLLRMAAAAEDHAAHPLAHAMVAAAKERGLVWSAAEDVQAMPGRGLSATVEGKAILLGNLELMKEWAIAFPADAPVEAGIGVTRLWLALDNKLVGYFDAQDTLRPSAHAAVQWLRGEGLTVEMLTGDSATAAAPIAAAVGIERVAAGLMPGDKVGRIRELQAGGVSVAMVGDGINDAAALAQADAGMAMGAGAALAQEAGDVLLLQSDPLGICTAIGLSRATVRVMRQNLGWAVGYNVIGIPLAAGLLWPFFHLMLTPWMAAAAMAFSSVSVLLNSLRLRRWKAPVAV
jgi:Cu+-exporting ATPase